MKPLKTILAVLFIISVLPACSAIRRGAATERYCEDHSKDHVYSKPLQQLKSQVMADIAMHQPMMMPQAGGHQGFSSHASYSIDQDAVAPVDDDQHFILKGSDAVYEAIAVTPETSRVQITQPGNSTRMYDREWLFLKRVDPDLASKLVAEADSHLDENGNAKN